MLSILIPIYNQDVRRLAYTLATQCSKLNINYQILCFDDGSQEKYKQKNKELGFKMNINYTELPENLGRSKIRNWLGRSAYFENLLFLDGDSSIRDKQFVKKYIDHLPNEGVIYGGRIYQKKKPAKVQKVLHWKYGMTRETLNAHNRNRHPYLNFQSNNFLVPAKVFEKFPFSENVEGYGYEDLQYADILKKNAIPIFHIHNPVNHDGLENNVTFLKKTKKAIENLIFLESKKQVPETRLQSFYNRLSHFGLEKMIFTMLKKSQKLLEKNLLSSRPLVFVFNFWKLYHYMVLKQKKIVPPIE
ncbi:MAG: glycosyltransferase [Saprospiraceae bacterium]